MRRTRHAALVVRCVAGAVAGCFDAIVGAIQTYEDAFDVPASVREVGDDSADYGYGSASPLRPGRPGDSIPFDDRPMN